MSVNLDLYIYLEMKNLKYNKIKTLIIASSSEPLPRRILLDTIIRGVLRVPFEVTVSKKLRLFNYKNLLSRMLQIHYDKLSYTQDWLNGISNNQYIEAEVCNITNLLDFRAKIHKIKDYELIVILHSALGDDCRLLNWLSMFFDKRKCKLVAFIGNEYDLLPEKKQLLNKLNVDIICTQLPLAVASWLYSDLPSAKVIAMPHALNTAKYFDYKKSRENIIGFIGNAHPLWIGDNERTKVIMSAKETLDELNLPNYIKLNGSNLFSSDWVNFLNKSIGTIGAESGTYYMDKSGERLMLAKDLVNSRPSIDISDLNSQIFQVDNIEFKSAKCISARHFEAIGTKTCQLLLEGEYNNILIPDVHYIKINKNLSNLKESIYRLLDYEERLKIIKNAYEYVAKNHTYECRVNELIYKVFG